MIFFSVDILTCPRSQSKPEWIPVMPVAALEPIEDSESVTKTGLSPYPRVIRKSTCFLNSDSITYVFSFYPIVNPQNPFIKSGSSI